jgi:hypothetical protein
MSLTPRQRLERIRDDLAHVWDEGYAAGPQVNENHFTEFELRSGHIAWRCPSGAGEGTGCSCMDCGGLFMCVRCGQAEAELEEVCPLRKLSRTGRGGAR